jgi:hypothetical protein
MPIRLNTTIVATFAASMCRSGPKYTTMIVPMKTHRTG